MDPNPFQQLLDVVNERNGGSDPKRPFMLLAGNGLSRLAAPKGDKSGKVAPGLGWWQWVNVNFKLAQDPASWSYLERDGLTLPEAIQLIRVGATDRDKLKPMYEKLWTMIEMGADPGELHRAAVRTFRVIVTTNYDTLFERAALELGIDFKLSIVGALPEAPISYGKSPDLDIVKLHGSFPVPKQKDQRLGEPHFRTWWKDRGDDSLIAGAKEYRYRKNATPERVTALFGKNSNDLQLAARARGCTVLIAGYGLAFEDDLVSQAIREYDEPPIILTFSPSAAEARRQRILTGDVADVIVADGAEARRPEDRADFYVSAFQTLNTMKAQPVKRPEPPRVLMVGQSSVNHVTRIKDGPPTHERSYSVDTFEGRPVDEYQVGGQALTPTLLLDRWSIHPALFSLIGFDPYGMEIQSALARADGVDIRGVIQDKSVITDHSYVITYDDVRILIDSGTSLLHDSLVRSKMLGRLSDAIEDSRDGHAGRRILYLTKWFLRPAVENLPKWLKQWPDKLEVFFETGTKGCGPASEFNWCLREVGPHLKIVIASGLFAMRVINPAISIQKKDKTIKVRPEMRDKNVVVPTDAKLTKWDEKFSKVETELNVQRGRSIQNHLFAATLLVMGVEQFSLRLRAPFPSAQAVVVTLGPAGAVVFPSSGDPYWIEAAVVEVTDTSSALGCGDMFRGAFLGTMIMERVTDAGSIMLGTRIGVHAGTTKFQHIKLQAAIDALGNYEDVKKTARMLPMRVLDSAAAHALAERVKLS